MIIVLQLTCPCQ